MCNSLPWSRRGSLPPKAQAGRFYERGCQEKMLPRRRAAMANSVMTASPVSVARVWMFPVRQLSNRFITTSTLISETEKRRGRWGPTRVLFEPRRANAFPGHARGDRVRMDLLASAMDHPPRGSSPSSLRSELTPMRSYSKELSRRQCRSKRLCRPIQFLRIERFSFLPNR